VPLTESSPVRSGRYPLRDLLPGLGEHYDKLDVEPSYLARGGTHPPADPSPDFSADDRALAAAS
jgi:hypothetical protein